MSLALIAAAALTCTVIDGDTLRCPPPEQGQQPERVRLLGIDAPELPGHCRQGRHCAPGNGQASKASLERLVRGRAIRIQRFGQDRYGRTLALAWAGPHNLACAQLAGGQAIYRADWDVAGRVRRCG